MWQYEKKLQYPVKIANPNPALAKVIISQLGGADFKKVVYKDEKQFVLLLIFFRSVFHLDIIIVLSNYAILTIISC